MKLILSALPILTASRVSRQTSTTIKSINDLMIYTGTDVSDIGNHGCHCGLLADNAFVNVGTPVDNRDLLCRSWKAARKCVTLSEGVCNGVSDLSYNAEDYDNDCANLSGCQKALCEIDLHFHYAVYDENDALETNSICTAGTPVDAKDSCCGTSASQYTAFASSTSRCDSGTIASIPLSSGFHRYDSNDFYFADEQSDKPGVTAWGTQNVGYRPQTNMYDGSSSTYVESIFPDSQGQGRKNHLFIFWYKSNKSYNNRVTTVTLTARSDQPQRYQFLELRCLKSQTVSDYTVCNKESEYTSTIVQTYDFKLPYHCNDDCIGLQVHNSGTGDQANTNICELNIEVDCADAGGVDADGYCLT